jgi:hypothetical protein
MLMMSVFTWEPDKRDAVIKRRAEKGMLAPAGMKVIGEWADVSGGRVFRLSEVKDEKTAMAATLAWDDLGRLDFATVMATDDVIKFAAGKRRTR